MENITKNADGTTSIRLRCPVERGGKAIDSLTMKARATVADLESMDLAKGDVGRTVHLIASLCNVNASVVRSLDAEDYLAVAEVANGFLSRPRQTGETSSET